ncbi:hypothetical protein [Novosphingobium sp.]|uniref:DUF805 domain-containing protein n=1 Tax=Novosphingobium sp. TaxID=1874826 RepID=UPI0031D9DC20
MSFHADERGKIGQSSYWLHFGGYILGILLLIAVCVYQVFTAHYVTAIIAFLAIGPLSIYFRVIMMRRCRDIGWPVILPWLPMIVSGVNGAAWSFYGLRTHHFSSTGSISISALVGGFDLVLQIVLGCIESKAAGGSFGDDFDPRGLPQAPRPYDDDAPFRTATQPLSAAQPRTPTGPRHPGGFGRRGL